jgi:hypothetical protein
MPPPFSVRHNTYLQNYQVPTGQFYTMQMGGWETGRAEVRSWRPEDRGADGERDPPSLVACEALRQGLLHLGQDVGIQRARLSFLPTPPLPRRIPASRSCSTQCGRSSHCTRTATCFRVSLRMRREKRGGGFIYFGKARLVVAAPRCLGTSQVVSPIPSHSSAVQICVTKISGVGADAIFLGVMRPIPFSKSDIRCWVSTNGIILCCGPMFSSLTGVAGEAALYLALAGAKGQRRKHLQA